MSAKEKKKRYFKKISANELGNVSKELSLLKHSPPTTYVYIKADEHGTACKPLEKITKAWTEFDILKMKKRYEVVIF